MVDNQKFIEATHKKFQEYLQWECNCQAKPFTNETPILYHHRNCHMKVVQTFLDNVMWFNDWTKSDISTTIKSLDENDTLKHVKDFLC